MNLFSRRSTLQAGIGAAALFGSSPSTPANQTGYISGADTNTMQADEENVPTPIPPRMPHEEAWQQALLNPDWRREVEATLYFSQRDITAIDPDLMILKAVSPMAKLTLQRRRNVQRQLDALYKPQYHHNGPENLYNWGRDILEQKVRDLMWGHLHG
jgi:hypothetical protein